MFHTIMINRPCQGWLSLQGDLGSCLGKSQEAGIKFLFHKHEDMSWLWVEVVTSVLLSTVTETFQPAIYPLSTATETFQPALYPLNTHHDALHFCLGKSEFRSLCCCKWAKVKVKVTFTLEEATKAQMGSRDITLLFL